MTERDEPQPEHLQLIESVVGRMAGNSFLLKGWTVTLVAALIALSQTDDDRSLAWIAAGVVVVFAFLDAFYLAIERSYRELFDLVIEGRAERAWTLKAASVGPVKVIEALGAFAVWPLHGAALIASVAVAASG